LLGATVAGIGGGLLIAAVVDPATAVGVVIFAIGAAMVAVGWRPGRDGEPIGADVPARPAAARTSKRPRLSGLGTRVEQILRLAEEQAAQFRADARQQADAIVAAAHEEARAIRARAEPPH
jgi:hypothetical protein